LLPLYLPCTSFIAASELACLIKVGFTDKVIAKELWMGWGAEPALD
jgi:hypothetical protein